MKAITKLKDDARKHEQRGEWEKAIKVYLQVLAAADEAEGGEIELPLYNRVGDLCVRLGRHRDAVTYYEQAADRYSEAGLYNNAIALCNKALRYVPERVELLRKLGQFSASQGFLTDARRYFLEFAEKRFASGATDDALNALRDYANVAGDAEIRELLGRKLHTHGRTPEGLAELKRAYALRLGSGEPELAAALRREILSIDPTAFDDELAGGTVPVSPPPVVLPGAADRLPDLSDAPPGARPSPALTDAQDIQIESFSGPGSDELEPEGGSNGLLEGFETTGIGDVQAEYDLAAMQGLHDLTGSPAFDELGELPRLEGMEPAEFESPAGEDRQGFAGGLDLEPGEFEAPDDFERPDFDAGLELEPAEFEAPDELEQAGFAAGLDVEPAEFEAPTELQRAALEAEPGLEPGEFEAPGDDFERLDLPLLGEPGDELDTGAADQLPGLDEEAEEPASADLELPELPALADELEALPEDLGPLPELPPLEDEAAPAQPHAGFVDLGALVIEETPLPGDTRFTLHEQTPTGDEDDDFAELLSQFRQKVAENVAPEDAAAHYDLGLAFKDMGLLDEAISELQVALHAGDMRLKVYEELGLCFLLKKEYSIAEKVLRRALDMEYEDELELLGVYFHLGRAYEELGKPEQARDAYERVLALDINFGDVAERIARL